MRNVTARLATEKDRKTFLHLWSAFMHEHEKAGGDIAATEKNLFIFSGLFDDYVSGRLPGAAVIGYENNQAVGVALCGAGSREVFDMSIPTANWYGLYVVPSARKSGAGKAIHARVRRVMQRLGFERTITFTLIDDMAAMKITFQPGVKARQILSYWDLNDEHGETRTPQPCPLCASGVFVSGGEVMAWIPIAAAGISAAGSIAGGLLGDKGGKVKKARVAAPTLDRNASLQLAQFWNLLNFGIVDYASLFQASPFSRAVAAVSSSGARATDMRQAISEALTRGLEEYRRAREMGKDPAWLATKDFFFPNTPHWWTPLLNFGDEDLLGGIIENAGFSNVKDFFDAQLAFEDQLGPYMQAAEEVARSSLLGRLTAERSLFQLIGNLPDASSERIGELRGLERDRLQRDINRNVDEQRSDLIQMANFGNFNPGGALGDLERFRGEALQDADLEALTRALTLIGGEQTAASNQLNLLQGYLTPALSAATGIASIDLGAGGGTIVPSQTQLSQLGPGVADAGTSVGNSLFNGLILSKLFNQPGGGGSSSFLGTGPATQTNPGGFASVLESASLANKF